MKTPSYFHTAIIGGGASGLFCAGSFDAPKIVLEANEKPAAKVSVSGGGKCNFSNRFVSAAYYQSAQKHFCKNALAAFKPTDFLRLLDEEHTPWQERENGQLFALRADDIVRFLVRRAKAHHTTLALGTRVLEIRKEADGFLLTTSAGPVRAQYVVLSCGGLSYPALGGSSFGIKIARRFGLTIVEQRAVLCGLTFPKDLRTLGQTLAGSSTPAVVRLGKHTFESPVLFTHEGISGPAILNASLYWTENTPVEIDFLPGQNAAEVLAARKNSTQLISALFAPPLPHKMAKILLSACDGPLANATRAQLAAAAQTLNRFSFVPAATAGYTKAEATAGGVAVNQLNPSTLEVKTVPGLFITGELLDVTGQVGGFNLHWAWASAYAAAQALKNRF